MFSAALLTAVLVTPNPNFDVREATAKGLKWLAAQQAKDGSWSGNNGLYSTALTAFAGLALLMEGSTLQDGTYAENIRKAVEWFEKAAQPSGLLVAPDKPEELSRYMLGHGFAMLFLACAYEVDDDPVRQKRVEKILARAVRFATDTQTTRGGWGYVSAIDGSDFDEANSTITMIQALLAVQRTGVPVPRASIDRSVKYLVDSTNREGGVIYSLSGGARPVGGDGRPTMTAGAAAAMLMTSNRRPEPLAKWVAFGHKNATLNPRAATADSNNLLHHYHLARAVNALGETGHAKLDPTAKEADVIRWSAYRGRLFKMLSMAQNPNGSWPDLYVGQVYGTSLALIVLQLENNYLSAFSR